MGQSRRDGEAKATSSPGLNPNELENEDVRKDVILANRRQRASKMSDDGVTMNAAFKTPTPRDQTPPACLRYNFGHTSGPQFSSPDMFEIQSRTCPPS